MDSVLIFSLTYMSNSVWGEGDEALLIQSLMSQWVNAFPCLQLSQYVKRNATEHLPQPAAPLCTAIPNKVLIITHEQTTSAEAAAQRQTGLSVANRRTLKHSVSQSGPGPRVFLFALNYPFHLGPRSSSSTCARESEPINNLGYDL